MIKEWLDEYKPANLEDAENALREIMQEIALAGLQRSGFFEVAAFYGGTALRIFHGTPRFSEDLDFSLLDADPQFELQPYLDGMLAEFNALGIDATVHEKKKTKQTAILILTSIIPQERVRMRPEIKIKIEVDTQPPPGFSTEEKLLLRPFSFYTKCFIAPDLFAGKMHALLFRKWKGRVKGRDWFDMEWFVKNNTPLHLEHLLVRSRQSGNWENETMNKDELLQLLFDKIDQVSLESVKEDIVRFIPDAKPVEIWSKDYFKELAMRILLAEK